MPIQLDIRTGVLTAISVTAVIALISLISGVRAILSGRQIPYFRMRREQVVRGWRRLFFSFILVAWRFSLTPMPSRLPIVIFLLRLPRLSLPQPA